MNGGHAASRKRGGAQNPAYRRASHFISQSIRRAAGALDAQLAALGLVPYRAPNVPVVTQAQIEALRQAQGV